MTESVGNDDYYDNDFEGDEMDDECSRSIYENPVERLASSFLNDSNYYSEDSELLGVAIAKEKSQEEQSLIDDAVSSHPRKVTECDRPLVKLQFVKHEVCGLSKTL